MYEQEGGRVASSAKPSPIVSITMPAAHGRTEIDAFADSRRCGERLHSGWTRGRSRPSPAIRRTRKQTVSERTWQALNGGSAW